MSEDSVIQNLENVHRTMNDLPTRKQWNDLKEQNARLKAALEEADKRIALRDEHIRNLEADLTGKEKA